MIIRQLGTGYLAGRFNVLVIMFLVTFFSALVSLYLWAFSRNLVSLLLFGAFYRLSARGYSVLYCRFATALTEHQPTQTWLYSIFESQRGIVIIISGIVSRRSAIAVANLDWYSVGQYERLILLVASLSWLAVLGGLVSSPKTKVLVFRFFFVL